MRRHLQVLRLGLDEAYPAEDWGFTAQQAVEKVLKAWIVLRNGQPPRVHDLTTLADRQDAGVSLPLRIIKKRMADLFEGALEP